MFVGFAAGVIIQVELLKPGLSFLSPSGGAQLLTLHVWAISISLVVICVSTISLIRQKVTLGYWAIWLGFSIVPALIGVLMLVSALPLGPDRYLSDTTYFTAQRHAWGTALLLAALGGLTARKKMKRKTVSLKMSFVFAFLITLCGVVLALLQARIGLMGLPRRYMDYPHEFAPSQFFLSFAAIACLALSAIYVVLLWRSSDETLEKIEAVF